MKAKVLIVDDERGFRYIVSEILRDAQYDVRAVPSAKHAKVELTSGKFDVCLVDLKMPEIDGLALMQWMKDNAPDVVPVVLSATTDVDDAAQALRHGAFDFITKPVMDNTVFLKHIERAASHKHLREQNRALLTELQEKNSELEERYDQLKLAHSLLETQSEALQADLDRAVRLQEGLLPKVLPFSDRLSAATIYRPAGKVGGDLFDIIPLDDEHLAVYVADTTGHGVSSAMVTVFLKHAIRPTRGTDGQTILEPGEVLNHLNETLIERAFGHDIFISIIYLVLNVNTMEIAYATAGHPPMLVKHRDGSVQAHRLSAPAVGINRNVAYTTQSVRLEEKDMAVLYTDGVTEASDEDGNLFGLDRLQSVIKEAPSHADEIAAAIDRAVREFSPEQPNADDITVVVLGIEPQRGPFAVHGDSPSSEAAPDRHDGVFFAEEKGRRFIVVCGAGSWRQSQRILEICQDTLDKNEGVIVLDFSKCFHMDSTFLGTLHNLSAKFDASAADFEVQNVPLSSLDEMSKLGLTSVLVHFRPDPLPLPESMEQVQIADLNRDSMGELLLRAHEALVEADPRNAERFAAVIEGIRKKRRAQKA